jgi:hypothetical protein
MHHCPAVLDFQVCFEGLERRAQCFRGSHQRADQPKRVERRPLTSQQTDMRAVGPLRAQVQEVPEHEDGHQVTRIVEQTRIKTSFGDDGVRIGAEVLQGTVSFLRNAQVDEAAGSPSAALT